MKKAPQCELIRGGDTPNLTQKTYSGKISAKAIMAFEHELFGIEHGQASLTFFVRDGKLHRYAVSREKSVFPEGSDNGL